MYAGCGLRNFERAEVEARDRRKWGDADGFPARLPGVAASKREVDDSSRRSTRHLFGATKQATDPIPGLSLSGWLERGCCAPPGRRLRTPQVRDGGDRSPLTDPLLGAPSDGGVPRTRSRIGGRGRRRSRGGPGEDGDSSPRSQGRPGPESAAPAPFVHAASQAARLALYQSYSWFVGEFRKAAEKLRGGERDVSFSPGCFPPALPFVPG